VCPDPGSDQLVAKVRDWINECVDSHERCVTLVGAVASLPKRLLQVQGQVCLVSPVEPVRYAALSYCWGGHDQHQTAASNVAVRHEHVDVSNLPQTLKDAIQFTRKLGVEYIWIDSLCIVQDDRDEWAREAAKMADVYSGAFVVLAATQAKDATEGFLQPHHKPYVISSQLSAKQPFKVQARYNQEHRGFRFMNFDHLPLSQRGWCLQEGMLASRIIHFLPNEIFYTCKSNRPVVANVGFSVTAL